MDWKLMICQNLKQEVHCLSSTNDAKEKYKKIYLYFGFSLASFPQIPLQ